MFHDTGSLLRSDPGHLLGEFPCGKRFEEVRVSLRESL